MIFQSRYLFVILILATLGACEPAGDKKDAAGLAGPAGTTPRASTVTSHRAAAAEALPHAPCSPEAPLPLPSPRLPLPGKRRRPCAGPSALHKRNARSRWSPKVIRTPMARPLPISTYRHPRVFLQAVRNAAHAPSGSSHGRRLRSIYGEWQSRMMFTVHAHVEGVLSRRWKNQAIQVQHVGNPNATSTAGRSHP